MAGLVGFVSGDDRDADRHTLASMVELITHHDFNERDRLSIDEQVCATRSRSSQSQTAPQPCDTDALRVWLEGEIYDRGSPGPPERAEKCTDPEFVAGLFREQGLDSALQLLREIDGVYSAVVHDRSRGKLHLITDRHGLRHLYWTVHGGRLVWASEFKAFLALPGFDPHIDPQSVTDFLSKSHFTGNRTWFENVHLLPSGSVLTWDIRQGAHRIDRYWSWDEIRPLSGDIDESEVVEELGRLFRLAVERRCGINERIGVHLSGGLDSRAIVAAVPERAEPLHLFTWGRRGCHDIRLAAKVAEVRGAIHHAIEINERNWLDSRSNAVWWLDGQMNVLDMHYLHAVPVARQFVDLDLNGFLGDAVLGGGYLDYTESDEVAVIETRGRRNISGGLRLGWLFYEERPVFFDNELLTLSLSIPPNLRRGSRIYNKMLLHSFPRYFQRIPWQKTGCPIAWPSWAVSSFGFLRSVRYGTSKRLKHLGIYLPDHRAYANYNDWLLQEPARSYVSGLLFDQEALYAQYTARGDVERMWRRQQQGEKWAETLCRYITLEVWLRQVFRKELRPSSRA